MRTLLAAGLQQHRYWWSYTIPRSLGESIPSCTRPTSTAFYTGSPTKILRLPPPIRALFICRINCTVSSWGWHPERATSSQFSQYMTHSYSALLTIRLKGWEGGGVLGKRWTVLQQFHRDNGGGAVAHTRSRTLYLEFV